jgi:hypothetical protein
MAPVKTPHYGWKLGHYWDSRSLCSLARVDDDVVVSAIQIASSLFMGCMMRRPWDPVLERLDLARNLQIDTFLGHTGTGTRMTLFDVFRRWEIQDAKD